MNALFVAPTSKATLRTIIVRATTALLRKNTLFFNPLSPGMSFSSKPTAQLLTGIQNTKAIIHNQNLSNRVFSAIKVSVKSVIPTKALKNTCIFSKSSK